MKYILGLDLGVASVGWALVPCNPEDISPETLIMGSRVFEAGTDESDGKREEGKDKSRSAIRRKNRGARRNIWRRRRRAVKLFNILQNAGLLPNADCHTPKARQDMFNALDGRLFQEYFPNATRKEAQTYIYALRAKALDERLSLEAIGRVFYAFGQRRGFLSNKKTDFDETDEELGKVRGGISELEKLIAESGSRTLGEFFSTLDPEEKRIRKRWTARKMFIDEFNAIWDAQKGFYPDILTDALRDDVFKAIFLQRPLKSQKGLVSRCKLEPGCRCAPKGDPIFQEYRYWQKIIDLKVSDPANEGRYRFLTREEQDVLAELFEYNEKLSFAEMRKKLGFKAPKNNKTAFRFNFELEDGDKDIKGNVTRARIRKALTETGAGDLPTEDVDKIACEILYYDRAKALAAKLARLFPDFSPETVAKLSEATVEPDYCSLSRKALSKVLPVMKEKRISFETARRLLYGKGSQTYDFLEPVTAVLGSVRNPTVTRTLTEMRKVVNEIIRRFGKPEIIRVELARDLKRDRKERERIFRSNKERENERVRLEKEIREKLNGFEPNKRDVLKYQLWKECRETCPYTGQGIDLRTLFSEASPVDIEHIIPFSVSLDDSFGNKTLCYAEANRNEKRNRTPFQAYGDTDKWSGILERVKSFQGPFARHKLELFRKEDVSTEDAVSRLLNDSRYISRLALKYLDTLYGATDGNDAEGKKRVQVATGNTTAWLRDAWNLNTILLSPDEKQKHDVQRGAVDIVEKNRGDHRHHAIDAAVIALTGPEVVKKLSENAEEFYKLKGRGWFALRLFAPPCPGFREILQTVVDRIVVSRRVDRKVSGSMHKETNYKVLEDGTERRAVRKPVAEMKKNEIDNICDPVIRKIVQEKFLEVGGKTKKFEENPPCIVTKTNPKRKIPIKSARYWASVTTDPVGKPGHARNVQIFLNHHMEVYAELDESGNELKKWKVEVVSLMEAYQRVRMKKPVVRRDFEPNKRFKFSLAIGEAFVFENDEKKAIYVVRKMTKSGQLFFKLHTDARAAGEIGEKGLSSRPGKFKERGMRKGYIDVLGNIDLWKNLDVCKKVYPSND